MRSKEARSREILLPTEFNEDSSCRGREGGRDGRRVYLDRLLAYGKQLYNECRAEPNAVVVEVTGGVGLGGIFPLHRSWKGTFFLAKPGGPTLIPGRFLCGVR